MAKQRDRIDKMIYLVPELCEMTGLTDEHRANFTLMKELSTIMHKDGNTVKNEVNRVITEIKNQERAKKLIDQWGISIENEAL